MRRTGKRLFLSCLIFSAAACCTPNAEARHYTRHASRLIKTGHGSHRTSRHHGHILQCVAFVRQNTDFNIRGNARDWWSHAEGIYARGTQPEAGAVLSFRPTRHMPLGHVAVVRKQIDSRTILIDQSHWSSNGVSRNVRVVDVSPANDWSAVRVALAGNDGRLGSIYPTHGFIYARSEGSQPVNAPIRNVLAENTHLETASVPSDIFGEEAPSRSLQ
ncbi:CHAP domain-containing protein [Bombella pollinis]|uniref:CHAP domain-containing protein n=1 Tax=Bombella pollinis TaxID=2967337 RepID=A0ABT3WJC2_9PROT|nr:CHAP domain-containing protein [Bombella pollinis]MCX5619194.1 CHAP domain-containing protein [Bombella pollinis]